MADATTQTAQPTEAQRGNRGRRRGGRGGRGGSHQPNTTSDPQQPRNSPQVSGASGRRFGGRLTNQNSLRPEAITFVPASVVPSGGTRPSMSKPQNESRATESQPKATLTRQTSRSTAPDLPTRIHEDIAHAIYECAICSNEVSRKSKVWSCSTCWTVFHIGCIKKWSKNEGSAVPRPTQQDGEEFHGECEDAQIHCQQECGKPKKTCGHPCEQPCHAPSACKEDKACPFKIIITCDCQRKKEEVKCNARAGVPDPPGRQNSLKCDDECARLERNRRLAVALNISDDHTDDHIPYSTTTLNMYVENVAWCHEQEEIFRVFAADENEKRYRFKPMRPRQRAFIHSLAEDFGFDGESLDPEPHRHILLFKTPKFVAAPMKTLAQAARIKRAQLNVSTSVDGTTTPRKRADEVQEPEYNGLLLKKPRFGLTEDELRPVIRTVAPADDFDIIFLSTTDAVALLPKNEWTNQEQTTLLLQTLQPTISAAVSREGLAASVILCEFEVQTGAAEPKVLREAGQSPSSRNVSGGWSQVAAKRSAPMAAPTVAPVGQRSSFTILGSKLAEAKKKKQEEKELEKKRKELMSEPVVEDWSLEVEREEEEKARSEAGSEHELEAASSPVA
ncbi:FKBP12-associated protein [Neophaeococcomyces mojaviensis]|uniref:FKBP12-associated protein n=1 Tax=Neophaeococcomyces mojaviensis TaxID=3383035 RepID=A0ACC3A4N5_9EURO|nr:FKBP12-associated protein [Knufia sp. JES_112]